MKKRLLLMIPILLIVLVIVGFIFFNPFTKKDKQSDALKFKEEYESLNGEEASGAKKYRTIEIASKNPFVYKSAEEIVSLMDEKETFVVYFGFNTCPWCRSILPTLIETSEELGIDTIYYVDVKEIRDTLEVNEEGKVETTQAGSDGYYELLDRLSNVLSDYSLEDEEGNKVDAKEKRIYAPNIVSVVSGKAVKLTTAISDKQKDGYQTLTKEILKDTKEKLECVLNCVIEEAKVCKREGC